MIKQFFPFDLSLIDVDKMINDIREQMHFDVVNDSSLIFEINEGKIKGELAIPGFKKEDISVRAHPKYLDVSGKMSKTRYRRIRPSFHRKISFPQRIDTSTVKMALNDGVFTFEVSLEEKKEVKILNFN